VAIAFGIHQVVVADMYCSWMNKVGEILLVSKVLAFGGRMRDI